MGRRKGRYGEWGKHVELFEMFESWRDDADVQAAVAESEGFDLQEGTGAPEGRADFPLFMLTTIRHQLRKGFTRRSAVWDKYMGVERAEDFREHTTSQLNGLTGMGPVPEFDEYPRIRSSEEMGPPYSVGKHGGVYGVTYEMVMNDEANMILNRTPTELGKMSAAYVSQVAIALIESNPDWSVDGKPFFTEEARTGLPDGNEFTGSGAEPTEDNLVTIIEQMRNTTDSEGFPIEISPENVLTRSERVRLNFKRIERSQETVGAQAPASGTSMDKGNLNPLAGESNILPGEVIVEPYLKDPNDWILFANVERPAFIIAFLRDKRDPMIATEQSSVAEIGGGDDPYTMDFDEIRFKLRHVFGVALGDPRAAIRARRS